MFSFLVVINNSFANQPTSPEKIDKRIEAFSISSLNMDPEKYLEVAKQIFNDSRQISYSEGIARSAIAIATVYNRMGEFNKGYEYLKIAENEDAAKESEKISADINFYYGQMYSKEKLYDKAIESYKKMLSPGNMADYYIHAKAYGDISTCFSRLKMRDSAFLYLQKSYQAILKSNSPEAKVNMAVLCSSMSRFFIKSKQNDSARFYVNLGIRAANESKHPYAIGVSKASLGMYYHSIHKNDSAYYLKSSPSSKSQRL